ncbi:MAG: NADH-quinone oxidoreductase subunit L [Polyangiales bacterium]
MEPFASWPLAPLVALAVPLTLALAGAAAPRRAELASGIALGLSLLFCLGASVGAEPQRTSSALGVRVDAVTCVMLLLVASLGAVIVRFSRTYLDRDPGLARYLRWLLLTLGAVTTLVLTNNLLVVAAAWTAASLTLHQLLTFFADRDAALVAAHKKFLVSRLADVALAGSLWLVHASVGSFDIDRITAWAAAHPGLSPSMQVAAALLVLAVALRSAQLPFHGWITQVMEAPTPVSALLHAGVVNVGGFVLIRLAPWVSQAQPARVLLVAVGVLTAAAGALVMTTRVSVKVALAWSTCAQMGFMLVQCGLGLWPLALLHLVAHSLYKAHAFLSAGSAVDHWKVEALNPPPRPASPHAVAGAAALAVALAFAPRALGAAPRSPADVAASLLLGLSLAPLLAVRAPGGALGLAAVALRVAGVVALYFGWHALAARVAPTPYAPASALCWWLAGAGLAALFALKSALALRPRGALARALHPWLFAGLFLDELFTRLTFRVWPPRLPQPQPSTARASRAALAPAAIEVQS